MQSIWQLVLGVTLVTGRVDGFMNILRPPPMPCNQGRCPSWQPNPGAPCAPGQCPPQAPWRPMIQPCRAGRCPPWPGHPHGPGGAVQPYGSNHHGTTSTTTEKQNCVASGGICVTSCTIGEYTQQTSSSCGVINTVCCTMP